MSDSFQSDDRWLWWGRLCLYIDRLELSGWRGLSSFHCTIPLTQLAHVRAPTSDTLVVRPRNREPTSIQIDEAPQWARSIRAFQACLDTTD